MKRIGWLILTLTLLSLPALILWGQSKQVASQEMAFDALARWAPGDAESVVFLDLKPGGEAGRHWEHIRLQLEANPTGQQGLDALSHQFRVEKYGLDGLILGPVGNWYGHKAEYIIAQVSDGEAAQDVLLQYFEGTTWEQEEYEGRILYHGRNMESYGRRERLAWTIHDGFLLLSIRYDEQALTELQALMSLEQAGSLAALPAWRTLRDQLPENPMGLVFFNVAEQARRRPPPSSDTSLGTALNRQVVAVAFAAIPEEQGMRVEIVGTIELQADPPPELRALLNLPSVDPTAWAGLPAETAIALVAHDGSVIWPWLKEMFNLDAPVQLSDTIGLDLEADLVSAEGPLTGDFALAITPPLPEQPIIQGLPASQLLILARGASEAQMTDMQARMEGRGAVFGPGEIEGVALQTQVGTELSGYAISYGFDDDTLLFGSSPNVIGQEAAARREGKGLVTTENFRAMMAALPDAPSFVVYLNSELMTNLARANMAEEQYQEREEYLLLETFEAIGLGLRFTPDNLDGVAYFFVR